MDKELIVNDKEHYLQINDLIMDTPEQYNNFWEGIRMKYPSYNAMFCFHDLEPPYNFLLLINAELVDDCISARLKHNSELLQLTSDARKIGKQDFFSSVHDRKNPSMY